MNFTGEKIRSLSEDETEKLARMLTYFQKEHGGVWGLPINAPMPQNDRQRQEDIKWFAGVFGIER